MDAPLSNRNIVRSWHEWEIDGRERRLILVIETDAEMQSEAENYDAALMEDVRSAAIALLRATPSAIDRVRIVPVRKNALRQPRLESSDSNSSVDSAIGGETTVADIEREDHRDLMAKYHIRHVVVDQYRYGHFRYSNLDDAVAQAKRDQTAA